MFNNVPVGLYSLNCTTEQGAGGIDLADSYIILLHLLNWYTLSPMEFLAADVNGSGTVTWSDYWAIVIGWFVHGYPFPVGDWVFESLTINVTSGSKELTPSSGGSSTGDINGSWQPGTKIPDIDLIYTDEIMAAYNQQIELPVYYNWENPVGGMVVILDFPGNLFKIRSVNSELLNFNYHASGNQIRISWTDVDMANISLTSEEPLFTIFGNTTALFPGNELDFRISPESNFMDAKGKIINSVELYMSKVTAMKQPRMEIQIYPNPVSDVAYLNYLLPEDSDVHIHLFNSNGQMIKELLNAYQMRGHYNLSLNVKDENLTPGYYFILTDIKNTGHNKFTERLVVTN